MSMQYILMHNAFVTILNLSLVCTLYVSYKININIFGTVSVHQKHFCSVTVGPVTKAKANHSNSIGLLRTEKRHQTCRINKNHTFITTWL